MRVASLRLSLLSAAIFWSATTPVASAAPPTLQPTRVIDCGADDNARPTVVTGVAMSADGSITVAACDDHFVRLWDVNTGHMRARLASHQDWVRTVALSADGRMLASGANDHTVCLWNAASGERLFETPALQEAVAAVSFHPNNQQLAVVGFSNTLQILNTSSGQLTQELVCPAADLRTVAFSPDGTRMAAAGRNGSIRLWNVMTGALEHDLDTHSTQRIRALAFSPDGTRLASAGDAATILIFDVATGNQAMALTARPAKVHSALFINNTTLAVGGSDNMIHIWDVNSRAITKDLVGHTGIGCGLACDHAGTTLVSGSYDTTLRVWDLARLGGQRIGRPLTQ